MAAEEPTEADVAAAADGLARLVRRVRSLSPRALQDRREQLQTVVNRLVAVEAELEGRHLEPPKVADHMFADVIAVIGGDVLDHFLVGRHKGIDALTRLIDTALADTR
ncbi:MAG: hypothetical protein ACTHK4_04830 [Mycobacteriales bacterium]